MGHPEPGTAKRADEALLPSQRYQRIESARPARRKITRDRGNGGEQDRYRRERHGSDGDTPKS
jgi:hypothetical protein